MIKDMLIILALAYVQNVSFAIVSRSRNRGDLRYIAVAAMFSNSIWFMTFRYLVLANMSFLLFIPYVIGNVCGCVTGVKVSMFIESFLGASADGHLRK